MGTATNHLQLNSKIILLKKYPVKLTVQGLKTFHGTLESITHATATLILSAKLVAGKHCFVYVKVDQTELYSRADVLDANRERVTLKMENGLSLFKSIARFDAMLEPSTLKQIIKIQSIQRIVSGLENHPSSKDQRKPNCWQVSGCGKEHYCAAGTSSQFDGYFGGHNGGRFCAFIEGTLCKKGRPLSEEKKLENCLSCSFYSQLLDEVTTDASLGRP
ncbi:MAG: serine/threonine kinase [Magnetococcales bacterium]|nr:serine/threonine kinase [Magnetococcales bacterium]HIJ83714.1 hypothetical protein [Magnetococcales bacterium]